MADDNSATSASGVQQSSPITTNTIPTSFGNLVCINVSAQAPLRLTSDNYTAWHAQWYSLLIGYDLMGYVTGLTTCPSDDSGRAFWTRQDHLLRSALIASLSPSLVNFVASTHTSRGTWNNLAMMYAKPSRGRIMSMRDTLSKMTKHNRTISDYMQIIQGLADSLALAGEPLGTDEITFHVLNGLGPDYKEISAAIRARDTPISFAELHDKLADYEVFLKRTGSSPDTPIPLTANFAHKGGKFSSPHRSAQQSFYRDGLSRGVNSGRGASRSSPRVVCQFCEIPGHSAKTCRKLLATAPWLSSYSQQSYKTSMVPSPSPSILGAAPRPFNSHRQANFASPSAASSNWLVDSGASHHVTTDLNNLALHNNYEGPDEIMIGDGTQLPITHTGIASLSSPSKSFLLSDVLCVPNMQKNLISVSKFCDTNNVSLEFYPTFFVV